MAKRFDAIILLGRPGCGKDTQAKLLVRRVRGRLINTGDLMRKMAGQKGSFAKYLRGSIMQVGKLAPPWLATAVWFEALARVPLRQTVVFNGSPRTRDEALWLSEALAWYGRKAVAVQIKISARESLRRLKLRKRRDDHPAIVRRRLQYFSKNTMPALRFFARKRMLITVNGEQASEKVFRDIFNVLYL